ncbi:MAG: TIGR00730 family Rossman fold protein [Chloroflexi bacterium]|nr:MAG: TIGR00730 family Rossman fold protein [Chloroflexota bacterium]
MAQDYEIEEMAKEESWRMFRIMGELVEGFDKLSGIQPAVTIYGSSRLSPADEVYTQTQDIARRLGQMGFSIITGGGPGAMEAANKGAKEAGATSVGLNIYLPQEQMGNAYTTKSITFDHFFVRKIMLVKYATAFVIVPGGLGTLDELTEVLTLMQTRKIRPFPVVLFRSDYWNGFLDWLRHTVLARGCISEEDLNLLRVSDEPETVVEIVQTWYMKHQIVGRRAMAR